MSSKHSKDNCILGPCAVLQLGFCWLGTEVWARKWEIIHYSRKGHKITSTSKTLGCDERECSHVALNSHKECKSCCLIATDTCVPFLFWFICWSGQHEYEELRLGGEIRECTREHYGCIRDYKDTVHPREPEPSGPGKVLWGLSDISRQLKYSIAEWPY